MITPPQFQARFSGLRGASAFTLTELLVAAALTSLTLLMSGMGLSAMMSSSEVVNESSERKDELNRAMDFIAEELREAEAINQIDIDRIRSSSEYRSKLSSMPIDPASIKEVLWFEVDGEEVVYYVGELTSTDGPWNGPQVVYRWGPTFNADGAYDSSRREHTLLIDSLDNTITGDPSNPICHSGWKPAFANPTDLGFFACVDAENKFATLVKAGRVNKLFGQSETIRQQREVYSRAFETRLAGPPPGDRIPGPSCAGSECITEEMDITKNLTQLVLENRGGAITCRAGGPTVATLTTVKLTRPGESTESIELRPQSSVVMQDVPQDSELRVVSEAQSCGNLRADSNSDAGTQVIMLSNGQRIPYYEPFDNQQDIQEFLTSEELPEGNNVLSLPSDRRVILFELGEQYSNAPGPAYDFQDVVIVIDLKPELLPSQTRETAVQSEESVSIK